jgi:hypothetical protein
MLSPARENSAPCGSDLVPLQDFVNEAELLQALQGNPVGRNLVELHPAGESGKHAALGRAEPEFWSFHRSNVPARRRGATAPMCDRRHRGDSGCGAPRESEFPPPYAR